MNCDFRCYVCGDPLGPFFVLVSLSKGTDRSFLLHKECAERVQEAATIKEVQVKE